MLTELSLDPLLDQELEGRHRAERVLNTEVPYVRYLDRLDWAEDPHGHILIGQFGQLPHTRKIPQDFVIKTRTPLHRRIRLGLLLS